MALVVVVGVIAVVVPVVALTSSLLGLRRYNRINPHVRTSVPLSWLWRVHRPARFHRRLRRALRGARGAVGQGQRAGIPVDGLDDCVDELERHAITVDEHLVATARFSAPIRRAMLRGLRPEVYEIEILAARIAATVVSRASLGEERVADVLARITERLDALDAAHREIAHLESSWHQPPLNRPTPSR